VRTAIYIDDSGTPGMKSKSKYDATDRKTWVALILKPNERAEAEFQMQGCLKELSNTLKASEFHFTDIYSGEKEFSGIELRTRLNIFRTFAEIHRATQFPMLIQTFTSDDIMRNRIVIKGNPSKIDNFDLKKTSDFALFFLLFRIKQHLKENNHIPLPIDIIIDEGRQKKNTFQKCELLKDFLFDQKLTYKSSKDEPLLQLIDFVAFSINKVRWILTNELKKDIDIEFLKICDRANFNILNIQRQEINLASYTVADYDRILQKVYDKNKNLSDVELEQLKDRLRS
jgi:hypothetical protein